MGSNANNIEKIDFSGRCTVNSKPSVAEESKGSSTHEGHRDRLRQKIESAGIDCLQPHEVLEYLLFCCIPRKDTNELAHRLIDRFGSLAGVLEANVSELEKVNGISHAGALYLTTIPGVARYYLKDRWNEKLVIKDSLVLGNYLCDLFAGEKNETFYVLSLDSQCGLIKTDLIYRGTINETPIYPRLIVEAVLKNNAAAVVLSHNHPGGSIAASRSDIEMTKTVVEILTALSVKVIDHVIVSGSRFSSMKSKGQVTGNTTYNLKEKDDDDLNGDWNFE